MMLAPGNNKIHSSTASRYKLLHVTTRTHQSPINVEDKKLLQVVIIMKENIYKTEISAYMDGSN